MSSSIGSGFIVNHEAILSFGEDTMLLRIPSSHETFQIDDNTAQLLGALASPDRAANLESLRQIYTDDSIRRSLEVLIAKRIVIPDTSTFVYNKEWKDWGVSAWAFHLDTRNVKFALSKEEQLATTQQVAETAPPSIYKCTCNINGNQVLPPLPRPEIIEIKNFTDLLLQRRTCRNFAGEAISQQTLSTVLFHTAGAIFELETDNFGTVLLKAAPSPGARHATEVYAFVNHSVDLLRGIYHYCVEHHKLNLIQEASPEFIGRALLTQPYFEDASAVFFFTSVVARAMWKYKASRIYRLLHLEVGHYCQNLLLSGTALGLGVFQTGALDDDYIEKILGIDGCREFLMYAAGIGIEKKATTGSHRVKLRATVPQEVTPKSYRDFEKFRSGE